MRGYTSRIYDGVQSLSDESSRTGHAKERLRRTQKCREDGKRGDMHLCSGSRKLDDMKASPLLAKRVSTLALMKYKVMYDRQRSLKKWVLTAARVRTTNGQTCAWLTIL